MIRHIVLWKFRAGEEEKMHEFLTGLKGLESLIEGIHNMQIGISVKDSNTYDACMTADFDSLAALENYKNDPRHLKLSALCKSIRESRGAIDFEIE